MNKNGPVIIIEDDDDDQLMFKQSFEKLGYSNQLFFFEDGESALTFLNNNSEMIPFLILSDINLPKLDGFALRDKIKMDAKLQLRCIPYLYFSTALNQDAVIKAYSVSAQGFFQKKNSIPELERTIYLIMEYWKQCASPKNFK